MQKKVFYCADDDTVYTWGDVLRFYADYREEELANCDNPEEISTLAEYVAEITGKNGGLDEIDISDYRAKSIARNIEFLSFPLVVTHDLEVTPDADKLAEAMLSGDIEAICDIWHDVQESWESPAKLWDAIREADLYTRGRALVLGK